MVKQNEDLEIIKDRLEQLERDKAVHDGINKWIRTVCITATGSFISFMYWLGGVVYERFEAIEAGVKAFWQAWRH